MSGVITVRRTDNAEQVELTTTTTGLDLFGDDRTVVAMRVNGDRTTPPLMMKPKEWMG